MAVFRVEKNKGYTVMSNHHLRNKNLTLKAKGLLSQMLSLPETWDYTLAGLSHINRESIDAIRTAIWELEKAGYITWQQGRDDKGKMAAVDTFAYRNAELLSKIHVFEVDHPDTQKFKRRKVEQVGWDIPDNLHYVSMDFTKDNLPDELKKAGLDTGKITFFSWLGVTYYLSKEDNANMIKILSSFATEGSSLLFDYADDKFLSSAVRRVQNQISMAGVAGEPMNAGYSHRPSVKSVAANESSPVRTTGG